MSISSAMQAGVAGLKANSKAVMKVSENIANSATVGYKRSFADMVTTTAGGSSGQGVKAVGKQQVSLEGSQTSTSSMSDLSIAGSGFFMVSKNPNDPVESNYFLTRAGSFTPDENGFLRNSAGYYLASFPVDADGTLGGVDRTSVRDLTTVNISDASQTAEASTTATVTGSLPSTETGTGDVRAPFVSTMRYTNALGAVESLSFSYQPSDTTANLWTVTVTGHDGTVYGTIDIDYFDSGATPGAPNSYTGTADPALAAPSAFAMAADGTLTLTIDNGAVPQTISISLGAPGTYDGITQFAGDFAPQRFDVDGSEVSVIASTEFDDKGILWGVYENGERKALYRVPVATVDNPDGLTAINGNAWSISRASGDMLLNLSGENGAGTISSYTLEESNVDIAEEMTNLIRIQRAYSSNATTVRTADEMLQETTSLKR